MSELAAQQPEAEHDEQQQEREQPAQQQVRMVMPPTELLLGETPDRKQVLIGVQTIYGQLVIPLDPNTALQHARAVRAKAKELNSGLVVVRHSAPGGVLLEKPDDDDDEDEDGGASPARATTPAPSRVLSGNALMAYVKRG